MIQITNMRKVVTSYYKIRIKRSLPLWEAKESPKNGSGMKIYQKPNQIPDQKTNQRSIRQQVSSPQTHHPSTPSRYPVTYPAPPLPLRDATHAQTTAPPHQYPSPLPPSTPPVAPGLDSPQPRKSPPAQAVCPLPLGGAPTPEASRCRAAAEHGCTRRDRPLARAGREARRSQWWRCRRGGAWGRRCGSLALGASCVVRVLWWGGGECLRWSARGWWTER